jgi:hypothetical protein
MKNPYEVLRVKEQQIQKVKKEIEALRIAARLLGAESESGSEEKTNFRELVEMP